MARLLLDRLAWHYTFERSNSPIGRNAVLVSNALISKHDINKWRKLCLRNRLLNGPSDVILRRVSCLMEVL
jgi:hypothetical protein